MTAEPVGTPSRTARPATLDHLSRKKPVQRRVPICLDPALTESYILSEALVEQRSDELKEAPTDRSRVKALDDARAARDAAKAEVEENTVEVVFQALSRSTFDALVDAHPPTEAQKQAANDQGRPALAYNPDTFEAALIAASAIEPEMPPEFVKQLFEDPNWNKAELLALWIGALGANQEHRIVDMGKG